MILNTIQDFATAFTWERVFFVSNDPRISTDAFSVIDRGDLDCVVQFNNAKHNESVKARETSRVYAFNNNHLGSYWGFTEQGLPNQEYFAPTDVEGGLIFAWHIIPAINAYIGTLQSSIWTYCFNYKDSGADVHTVAKYSPSAGYQILSLFHHVNINMKPKPIELFTLGFTGVYPKGSSEHVGHNFLYEHDVISSWSDLIRLDFDGRPIETLNHNNTGQPTDAT